MFMASFESTGMGLPADPQSSYPPAGFETTAALDVHAPNVSSAQGIWDAIKQDSESAISSVESGVKSVYGGVKDITKTVYGDVSSGVGTVYDDVSKPVTSALTGTYWYLILGVVVVCGGLYFVGKTGAFKVSV